MRLADFILANIEPILMEWESFARGITPGATMDALALRDHAEAILHATAADMRSDQSPLQRAAKGKGLHPPGTSAPLNGASELHAFDRLGSGFDLVEVVSEYRAMRASVLQLWRDSNPAAVDRDVDDLTRFNESIDQSLGKAVSSYTRRVDQSRDLFLAILSHDLRSPLNTIAMSAGLIPRQNSADPESKQTAAQISTSVALMDRMISDLLDYTRTRLGAGMPVSPQPTNLGTLCREIYNEYRTGFPEREINFRTEGDLTGNWDPDRMRQAISNLLGNAVQHGSPDAPINFAIHSTGSDVIITIHNGGEPIAPGELPKIFEPLVRGSSAGKPPKNRPGSIGLGLYIAREVARSHHGNIVVESTAEAGTTFTVEVPRHTQLKSGQPILDEKQFRRM